jgi:hypothetical protein
MSVRRHWLRHPKLIAASIAIASMLANEVVRESWTRMIGWANKPVIAGYSPEAYAAVPEPKKGIASPRRKKREKAAADVARFLPDVTLENNGRRDGKNIEFSVAAPPGCRLDGYTTSTVPEGFGPLMNLSSERDQHAPTDTERWRVGIFGAERRLVIHYKVLCAGDVSVVKLSLHISSANCDPREIAMVMDPELQNWFVSASKDSAAGSDAGTAEMPLLLGPNNRLGDDLPDESDQNLFGSALVNVVRHDREEWSTNSWLPTKGCASCLAFDETSHASDDITPLRWGNPLRAGGLNVEASPRNTLALFAGNRSITATLLSDGGADVTLAVSPGIGVTPARTANTLCDLRVQEFAAQRELQEELWLNTNKLVALAAQLKQQLGKTSPDTLSMDVIKKAQEIQKLAKSIEDEKRNAY